MKRALGVMTVVVALSAEAASLRELLEAADTHNLERQITLAQRQASAAQFQGAWTGLLPSLTATAQYTHNERAVVVSFAPPGTPPGAAPPLTITPHNTFDGIVRLDLPLVDVSRWFRVMASSAAVDAAEIRAEATRDAIRRQVAATYYGYAASLAVRASARRSVEVAQAQLRLQEIRANAGAATQLEVLRARAEVERSRQVVTDVESAVANTRRALRTLTGLDPGDLAQIPAVDLEPVGELEALEQRALELPAVKAAEKDAQAAGKIATASRLGLLPIVSANAQERFTSATTALNPNPNFGSIGIGLAWRLDASTWYTGNVAASQHSIARLAVERQRLLVRDQVHTDFWRLKSSIEKVGAAKAQVEAAERAAQIAKDRFELGAATQLDVIQSDRDLFFAEVNHIQAQTELASSHVALRLSAGLPLNVQ